MLEANDTNMIHYQKTHGNVVNVNVEFTVQSKSIHRTPTR